MNTTRVPAGGKSPISGDLALDELARERERGGGREREKE